MAIFSSIEAAIAVDDASIFCQKSGGNPKVLEAVKPVLDVIPARYSKECIIRFEKQSVEFYAYPLAIEKIEQELYDMPIFDEKRGKRIAAYYDAADELIEHHNESVRIFCGNSIIKKTIKPIVQDMGKYLVEKPVPDPALVDIIIEEIRHIADGETRRLSR